MDEAYDKEDDWDKLTEVERRATAMIAAALNMAPPEKWPEIQATLSQEFGIEIGLARQSEADDSLDDELAKLETFQSVLKKSGLKRG